MYMKLPHVRLIASSIVAASLVVGSHAGTKHAQAAQPSPNPTSKTCVPAKSDGTGGPYPAAKPANCTKLKAVTVWVIADPAIIGGFAPSNITIKRGTKVTWIWKVGGHDVAPFHIGIESAGFKFSKTFTKTGRFAYQCLVHPGQNGVAIVVK
jgi:plastocyanin